MLHRNSQKRLYINNAIYFITTNVDTPVYFFKEDFFCDFFVAELGFCRQIKQFSIFGYKVNPDHIHLLIQPSDKINYSEIMRSLKTNFSRNINYILGQNEAPDFLKAGSHDPAFKKHYDFILLTKEKYSRRHSLIKPAKFHWQSSFNDHIIRDQADYFAHLNYIKIQWKKHELKANKYCFVSNAIPDFSYMRQLKFNK